MNSLPQTPASVNLLPRPAHLEKQLERNRLYRASLLTPCPPSVTAADLAAEIARVSEVIRLIEIDLGVPLPVCETCGLPLEDMDCVVCRYDNVPDPDCELCGGTGIIEKAMCPDFVSHLMAKIDAAQTDSEAAR